MFGDDTKEIEELNQNSYASLKKHQCNCVLYHTGPGPLKTKQNKSHHFQESELLCQVQNFRCAGHSLSEPILIGKNNYKNQWMLNAGWGETAEQRIIFPREEKK